MVPGVGWPVRVLLADGHPLCRQGLEQLLGFASGIEVVGCVGTGLETVTACGALTPDVVLLDLSVPGLDAAEAIRRIGAASPHVRVILLATVPDRRRVVEALAAGAVAHCLKDVEPELLVATIRAAAAAPN
jgi:DNA-binding NarL/FixJ family response regulator